MKDFLLTRLREASTWRGIVMLLTAAGVTLNVAQTEAIIAAGMALVGLLGVFTTDRTPTLPVSNQAGAHPSDKNNVG